MTDESNRIDKITSLLEKLSKRIDRLESKSKVTDEPVVVETAHRRNLETSESLLNLGPAAATATVDHDVGDVIAPCTAGDTDSSDNYSSGVCHNQRRSSEGKTSFWWSRPAWSQAEYKREDQQALQILSKSARYADLEITRNSVGNITQTDLKQLFMIQIAHIRYLQDKYAALVVQGKFDKQTSHMFRALWKNTSGLSSSALANLKIASEISNSAAAQGHSGSWGLRLLVLAWLVQLGISLVCVDEAVVLAWLVQLGISLVCVDEAVVASADVVFIVPHLDISLHGRKVKLRMRLITSLDANGHLKDHRTQMMHTDFIFMVLSSDSCSEFESEEYATAVTAV